MADETERPWRMDAIAAGWTPPTRDRTDGVFADDAVVGFRDVRIDPDQGIVAKCGNVSIDIPAERLTMAGRILIDGQELGPSVQRVELIMDVGDVPHLNVRYICRDRGKVKGTQG